jgi:hypothetical protein
MLRFCTEQDADGRCVPGRPPQLVLDEGDVEADASVVVLSVRQLDVYAVSEQNGVHDVGELGGRR